MGTSKYMRQFGSGILSLSQGAGTTCVWIVDHSVGQKTLWVNALSFFFVYYFAVRL